nr:unnamed protein product [Callosobruchus chinensis]
MASLVSVRINKGDSPNLGFRLQGGKDFATPLVIQKTLLIMNVIVNHKLSSLLQRRTIRFIGDPALTCHLQPLSHCRAGGDLSLFYRPEKSNSTHRRPGLNFPPPSDFSPACCWCPLTVLPPVLLYMHVIRLEQQFSLYESMFLLTLLIDTHVFSSLSEPVGGDCTAERLMLPLRNPVHLLDDERGYMVNEAPRSPGHRR